MAQPDERRVELMARLRERVTPFLTDLVDEFYDRTLEDPRIAAVMGRLSPDEVNVLMVKQADHVRTLLTTSVSDRTLRDQSRENGRVHAMVGVDIDHYVEAVADHRRALLSLAAETFDGEERSLAHTYIGDRCMHDLQGALLGYRDLDNARHRVMLNVTQAMADSHTVADLARGVVEAVSCLQGISVVVFGRPDSTGRLRMEIGAGAGLEALAAEGPHGLPLVNGSATTEHDSQHPAEIAWLTGGIERCDSYAAAPEAEPGVGTDAAAWREQGRRQGWRSSVAIALSDRHGASIALVMLHAYWPGYFASEAVMTMLRQIKQSLESELSEIEDRPTLASAVSGYEDRVSHIDRLRNGSVEMLFQPVISLPDGSLTKVEALARLRENGRRISPAEFLPAFGDDELYDLFEQGLHQSLDALRTWESKGLLTGVSLNLPVVSPQDDRYSRVVADALQEYDVDAPRLTLELLETGFVDRETGQQLRWLEEFKDLGVRLAQDDLGSGYSSLLRLRHFAFDDVKIDQSLVRGTELAPGAALHFIEPINDIAHSLGLSVVIEGLEDDGLVEAGIQLAVDEGQGYGIARPMPVDMVVEWSGEFKLDLDPLKPRTPVGALAAHVCWEHRITALGYHHFRGSVLDLGTCALSPYIEELGSAEAVEAHQTVHGEAVVSRGSAAHRAAWDRLANLVPGTCGLEGACHAGRMRILVAGATGYIGSRLVPELLRRGHDVVATSRSEEPRRFSWSDDVTSLFMDASDPEQVGAAVRGTDAVCYLVHGLSMLDFRVRDRLAAETMRDAVTEAGVGRVVYLSGLVPDVPEDQLSPHIASRLEVERVLQESSAKSLSMRAGVVIGAGSTSFEIIRQTAQTLLVQPVPTWMRSNVQPIAVTDVVRVLADALEEDASGDVDIAGPDVISYPDLLALYSEVADLKRVQVPLYGAPVDLVALAAGLVSAAPYWTAAALVHSMQHDMVCRPGQPDPDKVDLTDALPLREAMELAVAVDGVSDRASGRVESDPDWVQSSWVESLIRATRLPGSTLLSSGVHVAEHRVRGLFSVLDRLR